MGIEWWFDVVQKAGAAAAVLELGALLWMNADRNRLLASLEAKSKKVEDLAERILVVATELKMFLFNERKA